MDNFDESFIDSVKEVDITIKDHHADDDFEKMFAELNKKAKPKSADEAQKAEQPLIASSAKPDKGLQPTVTEPQKSAPAKAAKAPAPARSESVSQQKPEPKQTGTKPTPAEAGLPKPTKIEKSASEKGAKPDKSEPESELPKQSKTDREIAAQLEAAEKKRKELEKKAAQEKAKKELEAKRAAERERLEKERERKAQLEAAEKKRKEQERIERLERERRERAKRLAQERERREWEREEREREQRMAQQISSIWESPDFSEGGRLLMNIKTEERKEIKVTLSPESMEKVKAARDAELAEEAKRDAAMRLEQERLTAEQTEQNSDSAKKMTENASESPEQTVQSENEAESEEISEVQELAKAVSADVSAAESNDENEAAAEALDINEQAAEAKFAKKKKRSEKEIDEQVAQETAKVKRRFSFLNVFVCFACFFGVGFYLAACERESGFIQSENRNLAEFPKMSVSSVIDGSYFTELTEWYTDTIPGREGFKSFYNTFTKCFGISLNDVSVTGTIETAEKEVFVEDENAASTTVTVNTDFDAAATVSQTTETTETEELAEVPEVLDDGEWMGSVIVSGSGENVRAMSAFYGTFEMGQKYAETINKYRTDLGDTINIYTMNMPISSAYYLPSNFADQVSSQHDCIKNIGSYLSGIINLDVYDTLGEHTDEYIYSRTDHHWTPLGAYYAAQYFASVAQFELPDLDTYEEYQIENFVGTMYAYSNYDEELNQNPDTFIYYKPDNDYTVTYYDLDFTNGETGPLFYDYAEGVNCCSAILGTDEVIAEIETDCDNGRVLVVIKDSFGNALIPFFTYGFEKIYVIDFRYFDENAIEFCNAVDCTDLLFAVSISAAHTESHINTIGNIRIQESAVPLDVKSEESQSDSESEAKSDEDSEE